MEDDPFTIDIVYLGAELRPGRPQDRPDFGLPVFRHDHDELHGQCLRAVARREELYPALIAAGRMDSEDADRDLVAWRELAAEWLWVCTGEGDLPHSATLPNRIAAIELAADRLEAELARGRRTEANLYQHHLLEALHWHCRPERRTHFYADLTRTLRAELRAASERKAA